MPSKLNNDLHFWNRFANRYDRFMSGAVQRVYCRLFDLILDDICGAADVLELAAGTGEITIFLSKHFKNVTAVDLSPNMLALAEDKAQANQISNIIFKLDNCQDLSLEGQSFDAVICANALHLFPNPSDAISEMHRVLRESGKIIVPTYCHGQTFISKSISAMMRISGFKAKTRWSTAAFNQFIEQNGFKITHSAVFPAPIPLAYVCAEKI